MIFFLCSKKNFSVIVAERFNFSLFQFSLLLVSTSSTFPKGRWRAFSVHSSQRWEAERGKKFDTQKRGDFTRQSPTLSSPTTPCRHRHLQHKLKPQSLLPSTIFSSFHLFALSLFCLFDIESRGRRAIMCLCVFVSDDGCAFYCLLSPSLLFILRRCLDIA